jgi:CRISPR/Cas system CSM-associated protein Csm4 (group 5 of RAMP superfamily)
MALIEVRLRPAGPWRVGHHTGDRERVDVIYHSDALFSAITHAMRVLGWLEEWLDATARAESAPAVRFSSLFPFIGKTRLVVPPKSAWPPANPGKLYLQGMKLVPLDVARGGAVDETRWTPDGASECLVPSGAGSPFHVSLRSAAAVDRATGAVEPHRTACLEFASNAGWWGLFDAANGTWESRVKSAFRLLADSGFGGERSRGWGRAGEPSFSAASNLFPDRAANGLWWLLSLYSPHESDRVDWAKGEFAAVVRGGWTDSPSGAGMKKSVRMIEEGSVLAAEAIRGRSVDVAPDGFAHPVYRSGFALAVPFGLPVKEPEPLPAEEPAVTVVSEEPEGGTQVLSPGLVQMATVLELNRAELKEVISQISPEELLSDASAAPPVESDSIPAEDPEGGTGAFAGLPADPEPIPAEEQPHETTTADDSAPAESPVPPEQPPPEAEG